MIDLDAFGAMLRSLRERRGLRPIDLALAMGWSGTAPVYRYEKGGPAVPRADSDTVNQLAQVLDLDYSDRLTLLGFAGHLLDTEPLTPKEEAQLLTWARPGLEYLPHPALLFDYRWRILALNAAHRRLLGVDETTVASWRTAEVTTIDLLWEAQYSSQPLLEDIAAARQRQLLRFQLYQRLRRHEAWYRAYPACRAHYPGFVQLWECTETTLSQPPAEQDLGDVNRGEAMWQLPTGKWVQLSASQRAVHGSYGLVGMLVLMPLDEATERALQA